MKDSRVRLKNPVLAGILAFLVPGAGHWYQGRRFKATVYSFCILTLFIWGLILGNGQPVYSQLVSRTGPESPQLDRVTPPTRFSYGYVAQFLTGIPALPSLVQEMRFRREVVRIDFLEAPIESSFQGVLRYEGNDGPVVRLVQGPVSLAPSNPAGGTLVSGTLTVKSENGEEEVFELGGRIAIGRQIFGSPLRSIACLVITRNGESIPGATGSIEGTIHRSFVNWYQAPRDSGELDRLHGELSRRFDIASVFTWIAGLLNLLAIWDAAEGPAYGYGDEESDADGQGGGEKKR